MLDLKIYARPASRPTPMVNIDVTAAKSRLNTFVASVKNSVAKARPAQLGANSVVVQPGGGTFPTITAALASITDASERKEYVVYIGAGTYPEVATCKSWVYLSGTGPGQTIITAPSQSTIPKGTVRAVSHSAVQNCTVQATTSGRWGDFTTAVDCQSAVDFDIENCELIATDATNQTNLTALALDDMLGSGSQVNISYTKVTANGGAMPLAINVYYQAYAHGMESRFVAENGANPGWGGAAADQSVFLVENCSVQGVAYSLFKDSSAHITANQCQLVGPVGPGVVVNK
jgi:pectin methylesterase-like acyl-CoA thioesterase